MATADLRIESSPKLKLRAWRWFTITGLGFFYFLGGAHGFKKLAPHIFDVPLHETPFPFIGVLRWSSGTRGLEVAHLMALIVFVIVTVTLEMAMTFYVERAGSSNLPATLDSERCRMVSWIVFPLLFCDCVVFCLGVNAHSMFSGGKSTVYSFLITALYASLLIGAAYVTVILKNKVDADL